MKTLLYIAYRTCAISSAAFTPVLFSSILYLYRLTLLNDKIFKSVIIFIDLRLF